MNTLSESVMKRSRFMTVLEAAFEYLISILVTGSFLATLTKELGISDSLTGILSSITSLGCLFQLMSLSINRTHVKKFVFTFSIITQFLFMFLYVVPLVKFRESVKSILFAAIICSAYIIHNIAIPKKKSWFMSLVDDHCRGIFTAHKEMLSLVSGMLFSFGMGALIDHFSDKGEIRIAFILSAIVIFVLMVSQSLTMIFTVEPTANRNSKKDLKRTIGDLVRNKKILQITVFFSLYYIAVCVAGPFYGTYQIGELGLSLKFISAIAIIGSISRILVSNFWGNYADRKSFAVMVEKCFIVLFFAKVFMVFAVPSTGKVMFTLYSILYGIAYGGINSSLNNLVYESIPKEQWADALAVTHACGGLVGFLTTLCVSPFVSYIQASGNQLFGLPIYAQQVVTVIALVFTLLLICYIRRVFIKAKT